MMFVGAAILFMAASAFAEQHLSRQSSCKTIRLDGPGGAFEKIPVYNQMKYTVTREQYDRNAKIGDPYDPPADPDPSLSGLNLCYAVVDSALIDAHRFANGDSLSKLTSPLSVALYHKVNFKKIPRKIIKQVGDGDDRDDVLGPGNPILALVSNREAQVCDQKWLEKYVSIFSSNELQEREGNSIEKFLKGTLKQVAENSVLKQQLEKKKIEASSCSLDTAAKNLDQINNVLCAAINPKQQISDLQNYLENQCKDHLFPLKLPLPTFFEGKDSEADKDINDKINAAADNFQAVKALAEERDKTRRKPRIKEKISEILNSKDPKPVGIGYCHGIMTGIEPKKCYTSDHTSAIIGQRWNGQTCEFLIRDSFGEDACKKSVYGCDKGSSWVPETDLIDQTNGIGIYWL